MHTYFPISGASISVSSTSFAGVTCKYTTDASESLSYIAGLTLFVMECEKKYKMFQLLYKHFD